MLISKIMPLLIDLLAKPDKTDQAANQAGQNKTENPALIKTLQTENASFKNTHEPSQVAQTLNKPVQASPDFLPLPLKTELFNESGFYIRNQKEGTQQTGQGSQPEVLISIRTENIGLLWISITAVKDSLKLAIYTENEHYTTKLKDIFAKLIKDLQQLGYPSVNANSITRPGIKSCADIGNNKRLSQFYLINQEV